MRKSYNEESITASLRKELVEKLDDLPESRLREVLAFVEFLTWQTIGQDEPLLSIAGILSGEALSAKQIEQELYGKWKEKA